jgi:hypothetical protein
MKQRPCLLAAILVVGCRPSDATMRVGSLSADEQEVVTVIEQLFNGIETRDTALLRTLFDSGTTLVAVREVDGDLRRIRRTGADFIRGVASGQRAMVERIWEPEVRVDAGMAALWAPYDFHIGSEFSHCGYDAFHLVRQNGRWLISAITYTVRTERCPVARDSGSS